MKIFPHPKRFLLILGFNLGLLFVLLMGMEIWARAYYHRQFPNITRPIQAVYPPNPINGFQSENFTRKKPPGTFRVLCLGASTSKWANYPVFIAWAFQGQPWIRQRGLRVEVYSTGMEAHTTLDSYYKYKYLYAGYDFDLVIIYHAVNDIRSNNCPPVMFRQDYSHFSYYRVLNPIMRLTEVPPLNRSFLALKTVHAWGEMSRRKAERAHPAGDAYVPTHIPREEWMKYGDVIRSAGPFRRNLENILKLAQERGQPVLMMTFAYTIPENYRREAFEAGEFAYGGEMDYKIPVELYGFPPNVRKGLDTHNKIIQELARKYRCYYLDQEALMGGKLEYFIDLCHFSRAGTLQFASNIGRYFLDKPLYR